MCKQTENCATGGYGFQPTAMVHGFGVIGNFFPIQLKLAALDT